MKRMANKTVYNGLILGYRRCPSFGMPTLSVEISGLGLNALAKLGRLSSFSLTDQEYVYAHHV